MTCNAGYYCLNGIRTVCPSGLYQPSTGKEHCETCPYNYYCSANVAYICPAGSTYSAGKATSCTDVTLSTQYIPAAAPTVRICPSGYYQSSSGTNCILCPAGYYCSGAYSPPTCGNYGCNYVSAPGMSTCLALAGSMQTPCTNFLMTQTTTCTSGQYRYNYGTCQACLSGYYCANPTAYYTGNCPAGEYSNGGTMFCHKCPGNYRCTGYNNLDYLGPGYYYTSEYIYYAPCTAGYFCPITNLRLLCPPGYYSYGGYGSCVLIPAGSYSSGSGVAGCGSYTYSFSGDASCRGVEQGYTVNSGHTYGDYTLCGMGDYSPATSYCRGCSAGTYCPTPPSGLSTCPAGFYCPGSNTWPTLCKTAGYCVTGENSPVGCGTSYFAMYGSAGCSPRTLSAGYYQYGETSYLKVVDPGEYLSSWSETGCPLNNYCTYGIIFACPGGLQTYEMSSHTGNFYCIPCMYGQACYSGTNRVCYNSNRYSRPGNTDCFQCEEDQDCVYRNQYFLFRDSASDQLSCPKTHYANVGGLTCSEIKQVNNQCPFGYYEYVAPGDVNRHWAEKPVRCLEYGFFGGANIAISSTTMSCTTGTYTHTTFNSCKASEPGYINPPANTDVYLNSDLCANGFFCGVAFDYLSNTESLITNRCPHGTLARSPFLGGKSDSETCVLCPPGQRCRGNSLSSSCPTHYICDIGTIWPDTKCPPGFYYDTTKTGATMYERCFQCPENFYCPNKTTESTMLPCPTGYFCGVQTYNGTAHPSAPGTVVTTSGGASSGCSAGNYCPAGASAEVPCPVLMRLTRCYYSLGTIPLLLESWVWKNASPAKRASCAQPQAYLLPLPLLIRATRTSSVQRLVENNYCVHQALLLRPPEESTRIAALDVPLAPRANKAFL